MEESTLIAAEPAAHELTGRILRHAGLAGSSKLVAELAALGDQPEEAPAILARMIGRDGALSGRLLQLCNCGPGGGRRIGGVSQAILLLGVEGVRSLVLGMALVSEFKRHEPAAFEKGLFWRRAAYAGAAAAILTEELGCILTCEPLVAALLMDCGMIALDRVAASDYSTVASRAISHTDLSGAEQEALGIDHQQAIGLLAQRWRMTTVLVQAMSRHHHSAQVTDSVVEQVAGVVWLAGLFAELFVEAHPEVLAPELCRTCAMFRGGGELDCVGLLGRIAARAQELGDVLGIDVEGARSVNQVLGLGEQQGSEARRSPRLSKSGAITIYPMADGEVSRGTKAMFHDVSSHGIGISLAFPLQEGNRFVVSLPRRDAKPLSLTYRVVRCERADEGGYRVGADLQSGALPAPAPRPADNDLVK